MTARLLFYNTLETGSLSDRQWIDKWCGVYGVTPIIIDLEGRFPRVTPRPPYGFSSLRDALACKEFQGSQWIWLDHRADQYWDEVTLPKDNVIYCIGHDISGFQDVEPPGQMIKVRSPNKDMEAEQWYASMVAAMLLFEVYRK
mgnify:CR=1 FL=1